MSTTTTQPKLRPSADASAPVPRGYKLTELGTIPSNWDTRPLGEIGQCLIGLTYDPSNVTSDGLLVLRSSNVGDGVLEFQDNVFVDMEVPERIIVREGDLLICVRNGSRPLIGKCALIDGQAEGMTFGAFMSVFRSPHNRFVFYCFQSDLVKRQIHEHLGATINQITNRSLNSFRIPFPAPAEQRAIAGALSDVDGLIGALDKLIAKKRAIKQAAMQQLLIGKTRLPGFDGKWETKRLGDIAHIKTGSRNNQDKVADGQYPFFVRSDTVERIDTYSYDCEAIIVPGEGGIGSIFHYMNGRFDLHQRAYKISHFPTDICGKFIYYMMVQRFGSHAMRHTVKATVDSLRLPTFQNFTFPGPPQVSEQDAIAAVLSDMDVEIAALERRRDKTKAIKQGMMQELLTGRIRLVKPQTPAARADAESKGSKAHSWAFNEAVIISVLAKNFGSEKFPLGRKRYTKLSYLLHRHTEKKAEGYLKKAAGPYNPRTKYGGPERIAVENGYVSEHKNGPYRGFVAADNIIQAEGYFEKWYGPECIQWLEQFRFKKNDELEVLATVDMAAEELRAAGKNIDVAGVKDVIRSHPEWKTKLDRPVFSDANIAHAMQTCGTLFG